MRALVPPPSQDGPGRCLRTATRGLTGNEVPAVNDPVINHVPPNSSALRELAHPPTAVVMTRRHGADPVVRRFWSLCESTRPAQRWSAVIDGHELQRLRR